MGDPDTARYWPAVSLAEGPETVRAYVRCAAARLPGLPNGGSVAVTYLDVGVMNYVYRVEVGGARLFLKQALPRVKRHDRLGPDLAGVPPARIEVERRALERLAAGLPEPWRDRVPPIVWYDAESNILWTADVGPAERSLQQALEAGECDPEVAREAGRLLGRVHRVETGAAPLWRTAAEDAANWERFLRMRTVGVLPGADLPPEAESATRGLCAEARRAARAGRIAHLDAAPKNVLLRDRGGVALVDFELGAAIADPAYDPGFLAGHYLLMGENCVRMRSRAREAAHAVVAGYRETGPPADAEWAQRLARYAGLTMLYRLYGSSPAPYLDPGRHGAIREAGLRLLTRGTPEASA